MATSNLISKSLGDSLMEAGNGTPDHNSPRGSTYVDQNSGIIYNKLNDSWVDVNSMGFGQMSLNNNSTQTTVSVTNTWYSLRPLGWSATTTGDSVTFSASNKTLVINSPGKYYVTGNATLSLVTSSSLYEIGIAKNFVNPQIGFYQGGCTQGSENNPCINVEGYFNFNAGDTVELGVRNVSTTNNALVTDANITVLKIGNL